MAKHLYTLLPGSEIIYRPYVGMSLGNPQNQKQTPFIRGLIDSGADVCMAAKDIAVWLGIQFSAKDNTYRIGTANGGTSDAVRKIIILTIGQDQYQCPFFFIEGIPPDEPPLLGQLGFFDHFHVCFQWKQKTFEIM